MGRQWMRGVVGCIVTGGTAALLLIPSAWAADEATAEVAPPESVSIDMTLEHLQSAIEAEADPELRVAMQEQLTLLETGQLSLERDLALGAPPEVTGGSPGGLPSGELLGPPVPAGDEDASHTPSSMTPELREQLFHVYDQVATGEVSEQDARAKAEEILREHGIDPHDMGAHHESHEQNEEHQVEMERAFEQMSPEAREQMEGFFEEREGVHADMDQMRETMEREFLSSEQVLEAPDHTFEAPTLDAPETAPQPEHYDGGEVPPQP